MTAAGWQSADLMNTATVEARRCSVEATHEATRRATRQDVHEARTARAATTIQRFARGHLMRKQMKTSMGFESAQSALAMPNKPAAQRWQKAALQARELQLARAIAKMSPQMFNAVAQATVQYGVECGSRRHAASETEQLAWLSAEGTVSPFSSRKSLMCQASGGDFALTRAHRSRDGTSRREVASDPQSASTTFVRHVAVGSAEATMEKSITAPPTAAKSRLRCRGYANRTTGLEPDHAAPNTQTDRVSVQSARVVPSASTEWADPVVWQV
jgi:hypothetical protein